MNDGLQARIESMEEIKSVSWFGGNIQSRVNQEILATPPLRNTEPASPDLGGSKSREPKLDSRVKIIDIRNINQGYGRTGWDGKKVRGKKHPSEASPRKNNTSSVFYKNSIGIAKERDLHGTKFMSDMKFHQSTKQPPSNTSPQKGTVNLENWSNQISQKSYDNFQDYSNLRLGLGIL